MLRRQGSVRRAEFTTFYEEAKDPCFRAVVATVSDRGEAEELLAEAFTRAWRDWKTVRSHASPRAWVVRTALNLHVDGFRRADTRRRLAHLVTEQDSYEDKPPGLDPELLAAVRALPEQQRLVVTYRVLLDLDTQRTAEALGISPSTVPTHLKRALASLRRYLEPLDSSMSDSTGTTKGAHDD